MILEVNQLQFAIAKTYLSGLIAYRADGKKYLIKIMVVSKTKYIKKVLGL